MKNLLAAMNKVLLFFGLLFFILIYSCDDDNMPSDSFLEGVITSVEKEQIEGLWSIFKIKYEGKTTDVLASFPECGRDFFNFHAEGEYREYLFNNNTKCTTTNYKSSWSLSNGIITISNGYETDQWVITELTSNSLVFRFKIDTDSDGNLEVFEAICNRYQPPIEMDIYSDTFHWDNTVSNDDKILLKWDEYNGYNDFNKYEVYRLDKNCNIANPELISTITDKNKTFFIDEVSAPYEEICYVFKIYTDKGFLGESNPIVVTTNSIQVPLINLSEPVLSNTTVQLSWQKYDGYYFSHYEITVRNYSSGSGGGFQEEQVIIIDDIEKINHSFELPYFENPVFVINSYNIFGSKNGTVIEGKNQRTTSFIRQEVLPINAIQFSAFSPDETIFFYADYSKLYRYNYNSYSIENSTELNSSSIVFVKVFKSDYGTEVIVNTGGEIKVYDINLNLKYSIENLAISPEHIIINENGYWLITDREKLYSFSRINNKLNLISTNNTYNEIFSVSRINMIDLGEKRILIGNYNYTQGLIVGIDSYGQLTSDSNSVNINASSQWNNNSLFSKNKQYLLNIEDNALYSTSTYNLITTLNQNFFPSSINDDGTLILGTNNNPEFSSDNVHEKKVRTLSYPGLNEQIYNSKGYPCFVIKNHLGQLISVSKAFAGSLNYSSPKNDIFIEVIE